MYKYIIDHIPKNTPYNRRPGTAMQAETITIHNTANPTSTAKNERGWLTNTYNKATASFHLVVDENEIIECIPLNEVAWHAGDGSNGDGNKKSIGIELCESGNQEKVWLNAVQLVAKMLYERDWGVDRVRTHKSWSGKNCPRLILPRWDEFIEAIGKELEALSKRKEISLGPPGWKKSGVEYLSSNGLVSDPVGWIVRLDEQMPVWAAMNIMANIHKDLKGVK